MSRLTGNDAKSLIEAYNAVYAPQQEDVVEEVEQIDEIAVNFGGQAALVAKQKEMVQQRQSDAKIAAARQQRFGGGGSPSAGGSGGTRYSSSSSLARTAPTRPAAAPTRDQQMLKNLGPAQYAAFKGGGGFAALQKAGGTSDRAALGRVVAQGRQNIGRFDTKPAATSTRPAPAAARPAAAPAAAAKTAPPKPVTNDGSAVPAKTFNPLMQRTFGYQTGNSPSEIAAASKGVSQETSDAAFKRSREMRQKLQSTGTLTQSFDIFDAIKGHLLDEGYADTEEAALAIMANMSEEWRQDIIEGAYEDRIAANNKAYDRSRKRAAQRAAARNAARDAGQTGSVPGVGYVTPRRERETYTDAAGTERHHSGAKAK